MKTKKGILKKACGKGGLKEGMLNIGNHAIDGAKSAYKSNMKQYKFESGINKTDPVDNLKAGVKGLMGGAFGVAEGMSENLKGNINKIKSIVKPTSPKKSTIKDAVNKVGKPANAAAMAAKKIAKTHF